MKRSLQKLLLLVPGFLLCIATVTGQDKVHYITLIDALEIAKSQSPDALNSKQQFRTSFWNYKSFRGGYLPQLGFSGTIPDFLHDYSKITDPVTGSENFILQQYTSLQANLALTQKIGFTGGTIGLYSGLQRITNYVDSASSTYYATPINISYTQPIFMFNPYRWDRKIEPLKYDASKRKYLEDVEQISITTTGYFFDLLQAQIDKKIALTNLSNYDTLYRIAKGRYELGKIAENDLLLLELNFLKAQAAVENANLGLDNALFRFKSYLRLKDTTAIVLLPPFEINFFDVNPDNAIVHADNNSSSSLDFKRRLVEAERDVRQAKMENRFDAALTASFGLTQNAFNLPDAYANFNDREQVSLGLTIPILDWGVARGKIKMAESQREIVKNDVEQEMIDFKRNVYLKVMEFNMQKKQLRIAAKSDTVAKKTYEVVKGRYLIGKMNSILDLNNAQIEADNAEKSYYFALQTYWRSYYELRKMTLFDFSANRQIMFNFEDLRP